MRVTSLICALTAAVLAAGAPAHAQTPRQESPDLRRLALKTAVFEVLSHSVETGLFIAFYGASPIGIGGVFAVNAVTSGAIYAAHEYAWESMTDPATPGDDSGLILGKAATYRVVSILRSFGAGYVLGGAQATTSVAFAVTVAVADSIVYAATELGFAWAREDAAAPPTTR